MPVSPLRSARPPFWFLVFLLIVLSGSQYLLSVHFPVGRYGSSTTHSWRMVMVTDQDLGSRTSEGAHEWVSYLQDATLERDPETLKFEFVFHGDPVPMKSQISFKERSMELSALTYIDGELLAFCDRSGQVLTIGPGKVNGTYDAVHRTILPTGDGSAGKTPFKSEWSTRKGDLVYVGSMGKEWVVKGEVKHHDLLWVKTFDPATNRYESIDWTERFAALRAYANLTYPSYIVNEAVAYDARNKEWIIVPRKLSEKPYDESLDEIRSGWKMFVANEDWTSFRHAEVNPGERNWGFTEIKLLPNSAQPLRKSDPSLLIGVKVKEFKGELASKLVVFDTTGAIHMNSTEFSTGLDYPFIHLPTDGMKFEGLEFVHKDWFNTTEAHKKNNKRSLSWEEYVEEQCEAEEDWSNPLRASVNTIRKTILRVGFNGFQKLVSALM